jgi:hypothetical protein
MTRTGKKGLQKVDGSQESIQILAAMMIDLTISV